MHPVPKVNLTMIRKYLKLVYSNSTGDLRTLKVIPVYSENL